MAYDPKMKTIVVDDMAVMRKMITKILSGIGFANVDTAADGAEAFKKIEAAHAEGDPFKFVLSDWNMPECTGIELLQRIRAKEELKGIPFLMVTAEGEKDNLVLAIKAGVTNFIVKPFTPATLQEKIEKIFK